MKSIIAVLFANMLISTDALRFRQASQNRLEMFELAEARDQALLHVERVRREEKAQQDSSRDGDPA